MHTHISMHVYMTNDLLFDNDPDPKYGKLIQQLTSQDSPHSIANS